MVHTQSSQHTEMADIDLEDNNNKEKGAEEGTDVSTPESLFSKLRAKSSMLRDLEGDKLHVVILFFLYCLQGIPLGLDNAIPLILSRRNVPYTEQATFSISTYPFSMKVRPDILGRDSNYFDFSTCFPLVLCSSFIIKTPGK